MRFLQIVMSNAPRPTTPRTPRTPEHAAKVRTAIQEAIANGSLLATGGLGKRATAAARVICKGGEISVEDPPHGEGGWMAGGGYSVTEFATKEDAIANAKNTLHTMGDGIVELIQVSEMHPPARPLGQPGTTPMPVGVVPCLAIDEASQAVAFYRQAFGAREIARVAAPDGNGLLHCHLEINGGAVFLADDASEKGDAPSRPTHGAVQLLVVDGDAWWKRAIGAGCREKRPFERAPWGDKYGEITDPFGVTWAIRSPGTAYVG